MRYLVFSDSHRKPEPMIRVAEAIPCNGFLFLGDGLSDLAELTYRFPYRDLCAVRGNNDWFEQEPDTRILDCDGTRIFLCHGHTLNVRAGTDVLCFTAKRNGCTAALFGHTHIAVCREENGLLLLNPGSIRDSGTFGILDVKKGMVHAEIRRADEPETVISETTIG